MKDYNLTDWQIIIFRRVIKRIPEFSEGTVIVNTYEEIINSSTDKVKKSHTDELINLELLGLVEIDFIPRHSESTEWIVKLTKEGYDFIKIIESYDKL